MTGILFFQQKKDFPQKQGPNIFPVLLREVFDLLNFLPCQAPPSKVWSMMLLMISSVSWPLT